MNPDNEWGWQSWRTGMLAEVHGHLADLRLKLTLRLAGLEDLDRMLRLKRGCKR